VLADYMSEHSTRFKLSHLKNEGILCIFVIKRCLAGNRQGEEILLSIVRDFDAMDDGDPEVPQLTCEEWGE
jgi:hypothetical protein